MKHLLALWLPWILSAMTAYTQLLIGNKDRRGWLINIFGQIIWLIWIYCANQWGLLPLNLVLWYVYIRNYLRWSM